MDARSWLPRNPPIPLLLVAVGWEDGGARAFRPRPAVGLERVPSMLLLPPPLVEGGMDEPPGLERGIAEAPRPYIYMPVVLNCTMPLL